MVPFETVTEAEARTEQAPDGSVVRPLASLDDLGSVATFELLPGAVSTAVVHPSVAEIWYVLAGAGQLWRRQGDREEVTPLRPGVCATLPAGTAFQFRAERFRAEQFEAEPGPALRIVAVTMPPWPGPHAALPAPGKWRGRTA